MYELVKTNLLWTYYRLVSIFCLTQSFLLKQWNLELLIFFPSACWINSAKYLILRVIISITHLYYEHDYCSRYNSKKKVLWVTSLKFLIFLINLLVISHLPDVCMCYSHTCCIFQQVHSWLEEILWDKKGGMDVYRCKGVLSIKNSDQLHTLQVDLCLR